MHEYLLIVCVLNTHTRYLYIHVCMWVCARSRTRARFIAVRASEPVAAFYFRIVRLCLRLKASYSWFVRHSAAHTDTYAHTQQKTQSITQTHRLIFTEFGDDLWTHTSDAKWEEYIDEHYWYFQEMLNCSHYSKYPAILIGFQCWITAFHRNTQHKYLLAGVE